MRVIGKRIMNILMVLSLCLLITGCEFEEDELYGTANVSPLVERWREDVERIAMEYEISEHVELILAMIAQESGGNSEKYPDILQSSESAGLPPGAITDPIKSLEQGIKYFASLIDSGKKARVDMDTILQSYNFGGGYIPYIQNNYAGKHSETAARAFSTQMAAKMGWSKYGDVKYVEHVHSHMNMTSSGNAVEGYDAMYKVMKEYEGVPYLFAGTSKRGIDCSAMTQVLYREIGISLPRTAQSQYDFVRHISEDQARPGDLVFFTKTYNSGTFITHVGVYTGNGRFFHAGGTQCQFSDLQGYYRQHFVGFGRK